MDSFDHYSTVAEAATKYSYAYANCVFNLTAGRRGGGCMSGWYGTLHAPANGTATIIVGCAHYHTSVGDGMHIIRLMDSEGRGLIYVAETSLGSLSVYRVGSPNVLLGRTDDYVIQNGAWFYIELKATISDSVGVVTLRVNEVTELDLTSQDTLPAGADAEVWLVQLRDGTWLNSGKLDDVYICDTAGTVNNDFLGDVRVEAHFPSADGNSSDWTPPEGATNWGVVDESPPNDTDYNSTNTLDAVDTFDVESLKNAGGTLKAVQMLLYHLKNDAGGSLVAPVVRVGGTDYVGSDFAPSAESWRYERRMYDKDPASSGRTPYW